MFPKKMIREVYCNARQVWGKTTTQSPFNSTLLCVLVPYSITSVVPLLLPLSKGKCATFHVEWFATENLIIKHYYILDFKLSISFTLLPPLSHSSLPIFSLYSLCCCLSAIQSAWGNPVLRFMFLVKLGLQIRESWWKCCELKMKYASGLK